MVLPKHLQEAKVASRALTAAAGGTDGAAATTGSRQQRMSDCGLAHTGDFLRIDEVIALEDVTQGMPQHPVVTRALARRQGFLLVPVPQGTEDDTGLMRSVTEITIELGDVAYAIRDALADDDVSDREIDAIAHQLDEMDAASASLRMKLARIKASRSGKSKRAGSAQA